MCIRDSIGGLSILYDRSRLLLPFHLLELETFITAGEMEAVSYTHLLLQLDRLIVEVKPTLYYDNPPLPAWHTLSLPSP